MSFNDVPVAGGDVVFKTNVGVFKGEMAELQAVYGRTVGVMSDDALKLAVAQERLNRAILVSGPESYAAGKATLAYRGEVDSLARSEAAAAAAAQKAAKVRQDAMLASAKTVGSALTRYVTVPTALVTAAAVKMGVDFQQQMLLIQTQAGASAGEVHKLSGEILQLAKSTPQGPTALAQAAFGFESVGLRGSKALNALKVAAIASGEGLASLTTTSDVLAGALVTGIQGTQNYTQAMDGLFAIAGEGKMHLQDLGAALGTGLLVKAKNAGVSLREVGAALAVLTDRNIPAQKAANMLGTTFALMQAPSHAAQVALTDMGISSGDLAAALRQPDGLLKVLEMLHAGMQKVGTDRGAADILSAFGRSRQSGAILTLVESLDSTVSSYQQKLNQYDQNISKEVANRQAYLQSNAYKLHAALSTVESDLTSMGIKIAPAFVAAIHDVSQLVDAFSKLPGFVKNDIAVIVGGLAVGGPLLVGIAAVVRAVGTIGKAFGRVPVQAGEAVAATDAELLALRRTAATTGATVGADLKEGVAGGAAAAEGRLAGLRGTLLGLTSKAWVIGIALSFIPPSKQGQQALDRAHLGFLGHLPFVGGAEQQVAHAADSLGSAFDHAVGAMSPSEISAANKRVLKRMAPIWFNLEQGMKDGYADFNRRAQQSGIGSVSRSEYDRLHAAWYNDQTKQAANAAKNGWTPPKKQQGPGGTQPFTTTLPVGMQLSLARAQLSGDVGAQRQALDEQKAFLQKELRIAQRSGSKADELAAVQALQSVQDELASLAKTGQSAAKKSTSARQKAYQAKLDAEENKLKINEARAKLAETKAGQNKKALDRAYAADKKALADEIDFYRKEARDQQLGLKARQEYAKKEIAAEAARARIGQQAAKSAKGTSSAIKKAEADFLNQLRDIFLNDASNIFASAAQARPNVVVNQSFPTAPADQHRQARMAVGAMRAAFDG